jgi:hypothetical protein
VSGEVDHFFDDVLIYAAQSMPSKLVDRLQPWELKDLDDFKAQYLSGFVTERYSVNLTEGFEKARQVMDAAIRQLCNKDIGGDHQRLHAVNTRHVGVTFKHVLLPVWLAVYRYQNQPYRILINGQTGKVSGARPYSWIKIVLLVLMILGLIAALFFAVRSAKGAPSQEMKRASLRKADVVETHAARTPRRSPDSSTERLVTCPCRLPSSSPCRSPSSSPCRLPRPPCPWPSRRA